MSSQVHAHLQRLAFSPLVAGVLVIVAAVYLRGWLRLRRVRGISITPSRLVAFAGGLLAVWIALGSPLAVLDERLLTVHMVKHLLLMAIGAPLILLGTPALPLLSGLSTRFVHSGRFSCSRRQQSILTALSNPVFCWFAGTAAVITWHFPALFQLAQSSHLWHMVEHLSFLIAGLLFWIPVVRPWPIESKSPQWSTPLYLFLATLPCDVLSAFLVFCGRVVYPSYLSAPRSFNLSALQDQQWAGALMWVCVTFAYLLPAVVITVEMLSPLGMNSQPPETVMLAALASPSLDGPQAKVVQAPM